MYNILDLTSKLFQFEFELDFNTKEATRFDLRWYDCMVTKQKNYATLSVKILFQHNYGVRALLFSKYENYRLT